MSNSFGQVCVCVLGGGGCFLSAVFLGVFNHVYSVKMKILHGIIPIYTGLPL